MTYDPNAPDWIDELIRGSAQRAAERMGLVPRTAANDPDPYRIGLDDRPDAALAGGGVSLDDPNEVTF